VLRQVTSYLVSKLGDPNGQVVRVVERVGIVDQILGVSGIGVESNSVNLGAICQRRDWLLSHM